MIWAAPWALAGLAALPALWWWHLRARPAGDRPFSAFFLVGDARAAGRAGGRLRAPWLLAARLAAVGALAVAAAGPAQRPAGGTLALVAGPLRVDPTWPEPIHVVRAGRPPTVVSDPAAVAPVDAPPDWGGALLLGQRLAPAARVVRVPPDAAGRPLLGAGAALDDDAVVVTAALADDAAGPPVLVSGADRWPMRPRNGDWVVRGALPAGPAHVEVGGARWPLCLPDARPLPVADAGWPPAVEAVLAVLPGVARVPVADALWRPGSAGPPEAGWAAFAPPVVTFDFAPGDPQAGAAPLYFAGRLPPPGAIAARWRGLSAGGEPILFAADRVAADRVSGRWGAARRFGFAPADTDLPRTAGWPVLFVDALAADRAARARCRVHVAGRPLLLRAPGPVELVDPQGARRTVPVDGAGRALVDGLDQGGIWRARSAGIDAWIAVTPAPEAPDDAAPPRLARSPERGAPRSAAPVFAALVGLLAVAALRRPRATLALGAAAALAVAALADPRVGQGTPGTLVVAVDTSGSMPAAETLRAVARLERAAGPLAFARVEGDAAVRRTGAAAAPVIDGGDTRHGPLLGAAAELAGPGGAVVLVSDGRAPDGPVAAPVPIFPLAVEAGAPDARIVDAAALRLGGQVFVRAVVAADRDTPAEVLLGPLTVPLRLPAGVPRSVHAVLAAEPGVQSVRVEVRAEGDRVAANDARPVPVDGAGAGEAVVVGPGAAPWARAAGLDAAVVPPAALAEGGARVALARAMFVHDQPAEALSGETVARLRRWVEAGGTLVLAGRTRAFGPGGWAGGPLDALSPLRADPLPPGAGRLAVALLLDRSGSMAAEAGGVGAGAIGQLAGALAGTLRAEDVLALLGFDARVDLLLPPTPIAGLPPAGVPAPASTRGGTRLGPALERGVATLARVPAESRVLVVVSDGRFADAGDPLDDAVEHARGAGVRVIVVLTGEDPSATPLAGIAEATGGAVHRVFEGAAAPSLVAAAAVAGQEGLLAGASSVLPEPAWSARVGGAPPPVEGRARVALRAGARALAGAGGEPLLAEWRVGRGQVIALATDRWALDAEQWGALLAPAAAPPPQDAVVYVEGDRLHLEAGPSDPPPRGAVRVRDGAGREEAVRWQPVGPGRATAPLPPGPVEVLEVSSPSTRGAVVARVTRPPPAELRATGVDPGALALQAALTGGAVLASADDLAPVRAALGRAGGWPLAPLLLLLALLAVVGDTWRWARGGRG